MCTRNSPLPQPSPFGGQRVFLLSSWPQGMKGFSKGAAAQPGGALKHRVILLCVTVTTVALAGGCGQLPLFSGSSALPAEVRPQLYNVLASAEDLLWEAPASVWDDSALKAASVPQGNKSGDWGLDRARQNAVQCTARRKTGDAPVLIQKAGSFLNEINTDTKNGSNYFISKQVAVTPQTLWENRLNFSPGSGFLVLQGTSTALPATADVPLFVAPPVGCAGLASCFIDSDSSFVSSVFVRENKEKSVTSLPRSQQESAAADGAQRGMVPRESLLAGASVGGQTVQWVYLRSLESRQQNTPFQAMVRCRKGAVQTPNEGFTQGALLPLLWADTVVVETGTGSLQTTRTTWLRPDVMVVPGVAMGVTDSVAQVVAPVRVWETVQRAGATLLLRWGEHVFDGAETGFYANIFKESQTRFVTKYIFQSQLPTLLRQWWGSFQPLGYGAFLQVESQRDRTGAAFGASATQLAVLQKEPPFVPQDFLNDPFFSVIKKGYLNQENNFVSGVGVSDFQRDGIHYLDLSKTENQPSALPRPPQLHFQPDSLCQDVFSQDSKEPLL